MVTFLFAQSTTRAPESCGKVVGWLRDEEDTRA
jgi:hypothetical protein